MANEEIDESKNRMMILEGKTSILYVDIKEFTDNVVKHDTEHIVSGTGIFDVLMMTATAHLRAQFEGNRIREEDYADMYVKIYEATLQAAVQIWLQKGLTEKQAALLEAQTEAQRKQPDLLQAQIDVAKEQLKLTAAQVAAEDAKKALYKRQIEGFDEDYKYKLLKIMMDSWAVGFSVAKDSFEASGIPAPMQKTTIDSLYNTYIVKDLDNYNYGRVL